MAKATTAGITLELSFEEARTLKFIIGQCVTGSPKGRRGHTDSIWSALDELGITTPVYARETEGTDFELSPDYSVHFVR